MVYVIINPPNLQLLVWVRMNKDRTIVNLIIDGEITLIYDNDWVLLHDHFLPNVCYSLAY